MSTPSSRYFSARSRPMSFPLTPRAFTPLCWKRETSSLLTLPDRTISTISTMSPSVTRSPFTKVNSLPSSSRYRPISAPPPWTMIGKTSGRSRRSAASSSITPSCSIVAPPSFTTMFCAILHQPRRFVQAAHDVHVLQRLAGGALDQIVDGGRDDGQVRSVHPVDPQVAVVRPGHEARLGIARLR